MLRIFNKSVFMAAVVWFFATGKPAQADIVFDMTASCQFDTCTGTATGVLDLADGYLFGDLVTGGDFVSFSYTSSDATYSLVSPASNGLYIIINSDGSLGDQGYFNVAVTATLSSLGFQFTNNAPEEPIQWTAHTTEDSDGDFDTVVQDDLTDVVFAAVPAPEPRGLPLLLAGLLGLGVVTVARRRAVGPT
jgi:hypothetical protein